MADFIVEARQESSNTIRVYHDDGTVQHYYGKLKDFTPKAVMTENSDGSTRVYFLDGRTQTYY